MKTSCFSGPKLVLLALVSVMCLSAGLVSAATTKAKEADASGASVIADKSKNFPVPRPPFSEGIFPCSQCHSYMQPNGKRRALTEYHTEVVLHHAEGQRWCTDCHDLQNRNKLRLVSGELIDFGESYRLCGQCHGDKFRDWKVGVHGKRTGYWNGEKQYMLCVQCHNPHDPMFKSLKPLPPPVQRGNAGKAHH